LRADGNGGNGLALLALAAVLCAGFASLGSTVVLGYELVQGGADGGFLLRTAVKAGAFGGVAVALLAGVWMCTRPVREARLDGPAVPEWQHSFLGLALALSVAALIAFPVLNDMPRAEPDEMHHLIVAKNLGLEGRYASGNAESGWIYFDTYDSVGAPVIFPAAWAIRIGGVDVGPPRRVIALYFLMLVAAAYVLMAPIAGGRTAAFGALLLALAPMSPYLARTVYGEVPGLAWVLTGLVLWRASWNSRFPWPLAALAGLAFGCAVLSKAYLVLFALPAAAAWLHDRWTWQRIPFHSVVAVLAGGAMAMGIWVAFTVMHGEPTATEGGRLDTYRHLLLFGLGSVPNALEWFVERPFVTAGLIVAAAAPPFLLSRQRHDPAVIATWMFAVFVVFWFAFFTPGHIPRYLWYSMALLSMFFAPAAIVIGRWSDENERTRISMALVREGTAVLLLILLLPFFYRNASEVGRMWTGDEMRPEREIARFVAEIPRNESVATAFWPLERVVSYYNGAPIPRANAETPPAVVLYNRHNRPDWLEHWEEVAVFGRYAAARTPES